MAPHKFDPARAASLDAPERQSYLPDDRVVGLLQPADGEVVLDVGAGSGRLSLALAKAIPAGKVVAIEENREMARLLRERVASYANVSVVEADVAALPKESLRADRALAVSVLHELEVEPALAALAKVLKPRGRLVVVDWERGRPRAVGPPDGHHLYLAEEAAALLAESGFVVERVERALFPYHFAIVAAARTVGS